MSGTAGPAVQLIEMISDAFANVLHPGDENLTSSTYGEEPRALVSEFKGKTDWRLLDAAFLDQAPDGWGTALSFFSDSAFRFYLPAYMIADIRGELETANDPAVSLCSSVTPLGERQNIAQEWGGGTMGERARTCFLEFSAEQVSAIVTYLQWRRENRVDSELLIEQALDNYWSKRDATPQA